MTQLYPVAWHWRNPWTSPDDGLAFKREFADAGHGADRKLTVIDAFQSIQLHQKMRVMDMDVNTWFMLQPHDVRRLIAELTEIADKRGL